MIVLGARRVFPPQDLAGPSVADQEPEGDEEDHDSQARELGHVRPIKLHMSLIGIVAASPDTPNERWTGAVEL